MVGMFRPKPWPQMDLRQSLSSCLLKTIYIIPCLYILWKIIIHFASNRKTFQRKWATQIRKHHRRIDPYLSSQLIFSKWFRNDCMSIFLKNKPYFYVTIHKIDLKWVTGLNVKSIATTLLKENSKFRGLKQQWSLLVSRAFCE